MFLEDFHSQQKYSPTKKPWRSVYKRYQRPIKYSAVLILIWILASLAINRNHEKYPKFHNKVLNLVGKRKQIDDDGTIYLSDGLILHDGRSEDTKRFMRELNLTNPGADGDGVWPKEELLTEEHRKLIKAGFDEFGCNTFVSDMIGLNRQIADNRSDYCKSKDKNYSQNLPKISVVVAFYNDPWSGEKNLNSNKF